MKFNLDQTVEQIKAHPIFVSLKDVVENIEGYHDHESVFDHLVKTANRAKEMTQGNFINNNEAKDIFTRWMQEDFYGITKADRAVLIALVHDCGKALFYEEGGEKHSINIQKPDGHTKCPGHEFWGGRLVVPELLKDLSLAPEIKRQIAEVVMVHDAFGSDYFAGKEGLLIEEVISDIKCRANGYYQESLFNQYADCSAAPAFEKTKGRTEEVFSHPSFYIPRKYFIS